MRNKKCSRDGCRARTMAKVMEIVLFTLIPIRVAAPVSSDTANMAWPILVLLIKAVSPTMITIQVMIVTMVTAEMVSLPSASFKFGRLIIEVN